MCDTCNAVSGYYRIAACVYSGNAACGYIQKHCVYMETLRAENVSAVCEHANAVCGNIQECARGQTLRATQKRCAPYVNFGTLNFLMFKV